MKPLAWMRQVRDDPNLTVAQRAVAWAIGLRADMTGHCFPSYARIAADCGMGRRHVVTTVAVLTERGWLLSAHRITKRGQASNSYQLITPKLSTGSAHSAPGVVSTVHPPSAHSAPPGGAHSAPRSEEKKKGSTREAAPPADAGRAAPHLTAVILDIARSKRIPQ